MQLARRSFDLHAELVDELDGDWGYRRVTNVRWDGWPEIRPRLAATFAWMDVG